VVLEVALDLEAGADLGLDQGADQDLEEVTKVDPNLEAEADLIHQRIVLVQDLKAQDVPEVDLEIVMTMIAKMAIVILVRDLAHDQDRDLAPDLGPDLEVLKTMETKRRTYLRSPHWVFLANNVTNFKCYPFSFLYFCTSYSLYFCVQIDKNLFR